MTREYTTIQWSLTQIVLCPQRARLPKLILEIFRLASVDGMLLGSLLLHSIERIIGPVLVPFPFYLTQDYLKPHSGFHLADASVYIACATSLAVFNIGKAVEDGIVIEPLHENTSGTIRFVMLLVLSISTTFHTYSSASHPKPFKCSITPRSEKAISLIQLEEHM